MRFLRNFAQNRPCEVGLRIFQGKVEKVQYDFLEKVIFDLQITIDRVHPVQIPSRSDHCITTDIM